MAALVLILGGFYSLFAPRDLIISHPGYRRGIFLAYPAKSFTLEYVTKKQCVVYGVISCIIGYGLYCVGLEWNKWEDELDEDRRAHHHFE